MPRVIEPSPQSACEIEECVEALSADGFEPTDEGSLQNAAAWLARLGNNDAFLVELLLDELRNRHRDTDEGVYGPQVVMLSQPRNSFFLRANIWPARADHSFRASGGGAFVYEVPHDHNFDFLTYGYFGPGYASDYYEYEFDQVDGFTGEKVDLRFVERSTLSPGKLMHYRAHRDVHSQLPPESISVSLNIMHMGGGQAWMDQYLFDTEKSEIAGVLNPSSAEALLRMAVGLGSPNAHDLATHFALAHPSDRMRMTAWDAMAGCIENVEEREALWRSAQASGNLRVEMEAKARLAALAG